MNGTRYELFRSKVEGSAHEYRYRLEVAGRSVATATAKGKVLVGGAEIGSADGSRTAMLQPTRRFAPKQWLLGDDASGDLATFAVSYRKRGATNIEMHSGDPSIKLEPADSAVRDLMKAAVLLDTDHFVLKRHDEPIATVGSRRTDRKGLIARARERITNGPTDVPSETMHLVDESGWEPDAVLVCAILVFKDRVIEEFRSP